MDKYFELILQETMAAAFRKELISSDVLTKDTFEKYPKKLYKFKTVDEQNWDYTKQMIVEGYIWASHPKDFSDPRDSRVNLQRNALGDFGKWIVSHFAEIEFYNLPPRGVMTGEKYGITLESIRKWHQEHRGENGNKSIAYLKEVFENSNIAESSKKRILLSVKNAFLPEKANEFRTMVQREFVRLSSGFRKSAYVACVTETYENSMMWEKYANSYSGIVIEYSLPEMEKLSEEQRRILLHLFPVEYRKRIPRISLNPLFEEAFQKQYYGENVDYTKASTEILKQLLYKDDSYNGEKEWRFIDAVSNHKISFPFISRVIAGYEIESDKLCQLVEICKDKQVELWVQKNDEFSGMMKYEKYR